MADRPLIKPGEWIQVGKIECVVTDIIRGPSDPFGDCEVVFDSTKPTNRDVVWDGDEWKFVKSGDYGGYAGNYPRLRHYVQILKRGRNA